MTTLYVAGPMTGYDDFNYPMFRQVGAALMRRGYTVKNPVDVDAQFPTKCVNSEGTRCAHCRECLERTWEWYMRKTIAMLLESDGVATLPLWRDSRGAVIEVALAEELHMKVMPWQSWGLQSRSYQTSEPL